MRLTIYLTILCLVGGSVVEVVEKDILQLVDNTLKSQNTDKVIIAATNGALKESFTHPQESLSLLTSIGHGAMTALSHRLQLHFKLLGNRIRLAVSHLPGLHALRPQPPSQLDKVNAGMRTVATNFLHLFYPVQRTLINGLDVLASTKAGEKGSEWVGANILRHPAWSRKVGEGIGEDLVANSLKGWEMRVDRMKLKNAMDGFNDQVDGLARVYPSRYRLLAIRDRGVQLAKGHESTAASNSRGAQLTNAEALPVSPLGHRNVKRAAAEIRSSDETNEAMAGIEDALELCLDSIEHLFILIAH